MIDLAAELPIGDGGEAVAINGSGRIVVNQSVGGLQHAYVLTPTTPAQECADPGELALARAFRPYLRFDDTEPWRPISLDALLAESVNGNPAHQVCHARQLLPDQCQSVTTTADLLAFEAAQPGGNSLDIRGDQRSIMPFGSVDPPYAAPSLAGCTVPAERDCDSGPNSVIYYNRTVAEGQGGDVGARSYWDYWWFFRYNHSNFSTCRFGIVAVPGLGQICYEHEGDWEGVTVVTSVEPAPPAVYWVAYSAHGTAYRYAAEALASAGRFEGGHAMAYIASGSHATYPSPCQRTSLGLCPQQEALAEDVPRPDDAYDGEIPWSRNLDTFCGATDTCVQPLPEVDLTATTDPGGNAAGWNAWTGLWGRGCAQVLNECTRAAGPKTPGAQDRYLRPWDARRELPAHRIPALTTGTSAVNAAARIRAEARCGSWLGADVVSLACDERALRGTLTTNQFDRRGSVSIRLGQPGRGAASFPGLAQVVGRPVEPGESMSIRVQAGARGSLWLRVRARDSVATARFDLRRLGRGGRFTVELRGSARAPWVVLRSRSSAVEAASVERRRLRVPPAGLSAVRKRGSVTASFLASGERTTVWLVEPGSGRVVAKRTLVTRAGRQATVALTAPRPTVIVVAATGASGAEYSWPRLVRPIARG